MTTKAPATKKLTVEEPMTEEDYVPANWNLTSASEGGVEGYNIITGRKFKGTTEEFNRMLR